MLLPSQGSGAPQPRSIQELSIFGHMGVFFLGAYLFYSFSPAFSLRPFPMQVLVILFTAFMVGIFIEGLQYMIPGRFASLTDILANMAGVMIFLSLKKISSIKRHILLHTTAVSFAIVLLWPFFRAVSDEITAYRQFPLLAGFETPFEDTRFIRGTGRFSISDEYAHTGSKSLKVKFGTQTYSGIAMEHMPRDWQGYSHLQFAVYNPQGKTVTLHTRIHDAHHGKSGPMIYADRFNRTFTLAPETWTTITISLQSVKKAPRNREMDMGQITNIGFFVAREPEPVMLYIDDIRLLKN